MKDNFTSINVILDRSGSMAVLADDTIGGFNQFLADQKGVPGEAIFTLCTFSSDYRLDYDCVKLSEVPDLDKVSYKPGGMTSLLDAVGVTVNSVGEKLAAMDEADRPSKVIFLIITDGQENSSKKFNKSQIKEMVEHQRDKYSWEFVFMGANIDAIAEGEALGVAMHNSLNYQADAAGTRGLYESVSKNMTNYRSGNNAQAAFFNPNNKS